MKISVKEVEYAAYLAKLSLTEEEKRKYAEQLDKILGYMEQLDRVDVSGVRPLSHAADLKNVFREDMSMPSESADEIIKNAPDKEGRFFKVKKVIE